jgi:short-subunit dehydrogenase
VFVAERLDMTGSKNALVVGNTDGIGLALTHRLLADGYSVTGISRRASSVVHPLYTHIVQDVTAPEYTDVLRAYAAQNISCDICVYCAGVGDTLPTEKSALAAALVQETRTMEINLMAAVRTTEIITAKMMAQGQGHFIGLGSVMDAMWAPTAPAYAASKAGIARYWESLALALKDTGVHISNIRFGFVDTKMAKAPVRPFLMTPEKAADFITQVMRRPRPRATCPRVMGVLVWILSLPLRLRLLPG